MPRVTELTGYFFDDKDEVILFGTGWVNTGISSLLTTTFILTRSVGLICLVPTLQNSGHPVTQTLKIRITDVSGFALDRLTKGPQHGACGCLGAHWLLSWYPTGVLGKWTGPPIVYAQQDLWSAIRDLISYAALKTHCFGSSCFHSTRIFTVWLKISKTK